MIAESTRTELLDLLSEVSAEFPSMRLGQLICNLAMGAGRLEASAAWDVEDVELMEAARRWLERRHSVASP